jgi:hypothetical protein
MPFIAQTEPAASIPSKNTDKNSLSPKKCVVGENIRSERKNPTQVPVHNIHLINSEINLPT